MVLMIFIYVHNYTNNFFFKIIHVYCIKKIKNTWIVHVENLKIRYVYDLFLEVKCFEVAIKVNDFDYFSHEGRTWYTAHRGRLWIAATAKPPAPEEVAEVEQFYKYLYKGKLLPV